jgi:serine/threonine protein kinase
MNSTISTISTGTGTSTLADVKQRFKLGACLGKGAFASVYKAMDRNTRKLLAVKKMAKSNPLLGKSSVMAEFKISSSLKHANVINTLEAIETPEYLFIMLELVDGGNLFSQLDPSGAGLSLDKSRRLAIELATGIQYLHSQSVVHCDLKPENVLVHKGQIKICDFGLAGYAGDERSGSATGTRAYMAPELINRRSTTTYKITEAQDVWSFGVVLYAMLFSDLPWEKARLADDDFKLYCKKGGVSSSLYPFNTVASPMQALLRGVLAIKASQRPSMEAVIEHMKTGHAWYEGGEKKAVTSFGMRDLTPPPASAATKSKHLNGTKAAPVMVKVAAHSCTSSSGSQPSIDYNDDLAPIPPYKPKQQQQQQQQQHSKQQQHNKQQQHTMGNLSASMQHCLRMIST